jgi:hypothetical protein
VSIGGEFRRHLSFGLDGVPILFSTIFMATGRSDDLPYMVEQWDDGDRYVEELIALTCDYGVARAAFAEAARLCCGALPRD